MKPVPGHPLDAWNTLRVPSRAQWLCRVGSVAEARQALVFARDQGLPVTVIGGGSNIVPLAWVPGVVIRMEIRGFQVVPGDRETLRIRVGAGEEWPGLVFRCLDAGGFGLENLADIPGTAGAAPVQNIGAFGVEVGDFIEEVHCLDTATGQEVSLSQAVCAFSYRNSVFKSPGAGRHLIVEMTLRLSTREVPNLQYEALAREMARRGISRPSAMEVARVVREIRRQRLPNPNLLGNAGSFFLNPVVPEASAVALVERHPDLPVFPAGPGLRKLSAGWLIEQLGFKGRSFGRVGVHRDHALVLVNLGGATGREVLEVAEGICQAVQEAFGVTLEIEPRVLGIEEPGVGQVAR